MKLPYRTGTAPQAAGTVPDRRIPATRKNNKRKPRTSISKFGAFSFISLIITLIFILAGGFGFLTPLNAGALIILLLAQVGEDAGLGTAAFETLQSIVQSFIFLYIDLRHKFPSPQNVMQTVTQKGQTNWL
jgi:hypothetical protein